VKDIIGYGCVIGGVCFLGWNIGGLLMGKPPSLVAEPVEAPAAPEPTTIGENRWHDGHLWILDATGYSTKWQPIHHPDCPCKGVKP
jgi:hypothetical protein